MTKIKFFCDSGANIHSAKEEEFDLTDIWGYTEEEWEELSDDERYAIVEEWAINSGLEIGWTKI